MLPDHAAAIFSRGRHSRLAGGFRLSEHVAAERLKALLVDEGREVELADHLGVDLIVKQYADFAGRRNGDRTRVLGNCDAVADLEAVDRDHQAFAAAVEGAVPCIGDLPIRQLDLEPALAFEGEVQLVAGLDLRALLDIHVHGGGTHAEAQLNPSRQTCARR